MELCSFLGDSEGSKRIRKTHKIKSEGGLAFTPRDTLKNYKLTSGDPDNFYEKKYLSGTRAHR